MFRRGGWTRPTRQYDHSHGCTCSPQPAPGIQPAQGIKRYIMRQRMVTLGQDFDIKNASGQPVYKIKGKVRIIKEALKFYDMQGNLLYKLDEKVLRIRESFDILKADGSLAAKVHNAIFDPLREKFTIEIPGGQNMLTMGKVIWAQYDILSSGQQVAKISKQFSWIGRDQYVVDILPGQDDCLLLAVTVVIDMMVSNGR